VVLLGIPDGTTVGDLLPFVLIGLVYPALFRVLYYKGIDVVGANLSGAIVATNPFVASLLAVGLLEEAFTVWTATWMVLIVAGAMVLQLTKREVEDAGEVTDVLLDEVLRARYRDFAYPVGAMVTAGIGVVGIDIGLTNYPHTLGATTVTQGTAVVALAALAIGPADVHAQLRVTGVDPVSMTFLGASGVTIAVARVTQFYAL